MAKRLVDLPVESVDDESLGVSQYAELLAKFIINCETPITIGIQGDWGIGKTSLMNMIKGLLGPRPRRQNRYHIIYFNTWQFSQFNQEEFLGLSILKGIMSEIAKLGQSVGQERKDNFQESLKSFGKFVTALGNQVVRAKTGLDFQEAAASSFSSKEGTDLDVDITQQLRELKASFERLVASLIENEGDRLVVMIDDLDRIRPVKALEFLESLKNFLDAQYCVFVIAIDYSVVQQGMVEKLGKSAQELQGKSYFDKIIQIPFNMPVTSYMTDRYIMSLLGWNYDEANRKYQQQKRDEFFLKVRDTSIDKDVVTFFTNITTLTVGKNPRSIKRAVNYANLLRMIVQAKRAREASGTQWKIIDAKHLYPLACMQLAWPELFRHFCEKPSPQSIHLLQDFDYLESLEGMNVLFKRVYNPEEVKSNITGFFDEYTSLVDQDGNGEIDLEEFRPIWSIMRDANLTGYKLKDVDEDWKHFRDLVRESGADPATMKLVDDILELFKATKWNDPSKFELLDAGKRFKNLMWDRNQVGSLVSTKGEPLQMYLKVFVEDCVDGEKGVDVSFVEDVRSRGHYGTGDTRVKLFEIVKQPNAKQIMDNLLAAVLKATQ